MFNAKMRRFTYGKIFPEKETECDGYITCDFDGAEDYG